MPLRPCVLVLVGALFLSIFSASARADELTGKNCMGEGRAKWLLSEAVIGQMNPIGGENQLQVSQCEPLIRRPGVLFDLTNVQVGLVSNTAPVYTNTGVFASLMPLSVLELRAEATWVGYWPIGLDAASYYPLASHEAPFEILPADEGVSADGVNANLGAKLQFELPLATGVTLAAVDSMTAEYWAVGQGAYYYNVRRDVVTARSDWIVKNSAMLLVGYQATPRWLLRAGLYDDLTYVPASGYTANVLSLLLTAVVDRWPTDDAQTQPFLSVGAYTHHAFRTGLMLVGGLCFSFDLTGRGRAAH